MNLDEVEEFHFQRNEKLKTAAKRRARPTQDDGLSDEEVFALKTSNEKVEDLYGDTQTKGEYEGWGHTRDTYYGAEDVQDEEEAKMEEEEALRLQKQHLQELSGADYLDDEIDDSDEDGDNAGWGSNKAKNDETESNFDEGVQAEELPVYDLSTLGDKERLDFLRLSYPEITLFGEELSKNQPILDRLAEDGAPSDDGIAGVQFAALSSYLGAISIYFALLLDKLSRSQSKKAPNLKEHPVMGAILRAREIWRLSQRMDSTTVLEHGSDSSSDSIAEQEQIQELDQSDESTQSSDYDDESVEQSLDTPQSISSGEDSEDEDEFDVKPKTGKRLKTTGLAGSDYGEMNEEDDIDLEEKERRRKSLRFYTAKIDKQSLKDQSKLSGDTDLPYKERISERTKRLTEEARLRGLSSKKDDAENFESDDDKPNVDRPAHVDEDAKLRRKEARKEAHKLAIKAAREGKLAEAKDTIGEDGKRAVNYQILKNKGLTPKRNKDNRNARVKKRKRFDSAQKKLASSRPVYKTPESAYAGEKTGISKLTTKSVKFKD